MMSECGLVLSSQTSKLVVLNFVGVMHGIIGMYHFIDN